MRKKTIKKVDGVFEYIGVKPNSDFVKGLLDMNESGFIKTNTTMETSVSGIFAAGDVIEAKDEKGAVMPATVETARQTGIAIAKNIRNTIDKQPLVKYKTTSPGVLVALGGNYAVGVLNIGSNFSIKISGIFAYIVKHFVFFIYRKPLQNISRTGYKRFCKEIKDKRCRVIVLAAAI